MKYVRFIHRWTGLLTGLFLLISALSGAFILIGRLSGSYAPVFRLMTTLHRNLFLGDAGSLIIGVATLLLVVEVITGYCLWVKSARGLMNASRKRGAGSLKGFARSLSWTFPTRTRGFHVAGGFWAGIPLLLMALTGLTWCFGWYAELVYGLFDPAGTANLFHSIAALHTGGWLGVASRIVWLAAAILGVMLPITGLLLYLRRHPKKKPRSKLNAD